MTAAEAAAGCTLALVTHSHPDHCDPAFFDALDPSVAVLVPEGFRFMGGYKAPQRLDRMTPWETRELTDLRITCTPAVHPGAACGFVVESDNRRLYLAGDTSFAPFFAEVGERLRPDAAALPIKAFRMGPGLTSDNIVDAVSALGVQRVIAIHVHLMMTFWPLKLGDPVPGVTRAALDGLPDVAFSAPAPGDVVVI